MRYETAKAVVTKIRKVPNQPSLRKKLAKALTTVSFHEEQWYPPENGDACEICLGRNGGTPGNENIVDGVVMCDQCTADTLAMKEREQ